MEMNNHSSSLFCLLLDSDIVDHFSLSVGVMPIESQILPSKYDDRLTTIFIRSVPIERADGNRCEMRIDCSTRMVLDDPEASMKIILDTIENRIKDLTEETENE